MKFGVIDPQAGFMSLVTAMSVKRHEVVQKLLAELAASFLETAAVKIDPPLFLDKPAGPKLMEIKSPPRAAARPGRRGRRGS